jgi:DNA polymerase III subunit epsilon
MTYVVLDFETTGLNFYTEQVIEISAIKLDDDFNEVGTFNTFVRLQTGKELPEFITNLTGITWLHLQYGMKLEVAFDLLKVFIGDATVIAQYAPFDLAFLQKHDIVPKRFYCTKSLTAIAEPNESSSLVPTCERLGIKLENAHRAIDDCRATADVFKIRYKQFNGEYANTLVVAEGRPLNFIPQATDVILTKTGNLIADFKGVK